MNRRRFVLRSVAAVGALGVGWSVLPPRSRLGDGDGIAEEPGEHALNGWVKISADNRVTVIMSKAEMGQGIHTALAMVLADELDADWSQVRIEMSPIGGIYNNIASVIDSLPLQPDDHGLMQRTLAWFTAKSMREIGVMMTGGSSSMKDLWLPMRQAGASARAMLIAAAAAEWKVDASEISIDSGIVQHSSGKRANFGALISAASRQPLMGNAPLKSPEQFRLIGKTTRRLEAAAKQAGTAIFGIDVALPDMLYASVAMCPTLGGTVTAFDGTAARAMPGVKHVMSVDGYNGGTAGIAVIADTPFHAMKAVRSVNVTWNHGAMANVSSAQIMTELAQSLDAGSGHVYRSDGDIDAALASSATQVAAEYRAPYLAHATMEPINCTVQVKDGRATVWASTQVPDLARRAAAAAIGLSRDKVDVKVQLIGGGFGRRLDVDFIGQAAAIANVAAGVPVQTIWSREEDVRHDFYRPACVSRATAGLDGNGTLVAWRTTSASQPLISNVMQRLFDLPSGPIEKTVIEGAYDQPYEFPASRIAHRNVSLPVPVGFWRSVGHSHQAFFTESFMDEVAVAAKQDPVAFRLALLKNHPRHAAVLRRVVELAGWNTPMPAPGDDMRTGRGVALHESFGGIVAQVVEVRIDASNSFRVTRVVCVIDCGLPVNPGTIRQQLESGIIFGLSAALHGEITLENGRVRQSNFYDYQAVRMQDTPLIETDIMPSAAHPEGVGEPPLPPLAPAIANALFAATGTRLRTLPLRLPPVAGTT